jgi:single-strand DNA-binding protein
MASYRIVGWIGQYRRTVFAQRQFCLCRGRIRTEEYVDKDGITRRGIRIRGTSMTLVGGGNRDNSASGDGSTQMAAPAPARPNPAPVTPPPPAFDAGGDSDDLPF